MQKRGAKKLGRPRGRYPSSADHRRLEYLALISSKYDLDSEELFDSFVEAWNHQEARCKSLSIECRIKKRDYGVFLIIKDSQVIAQFSMPIRILEDTGQLKKILQTIVSQRIPSAATKGDKMERRRIGELKVGMKRINLEARVLEIPKPRSVFTRYGNFAIVANASIADETGSIQLPLWNRQIDAVSAGDLIQVENARVATFKGQRQLVVCRGGQLDVIEKR